MNKYIKILLLVILAVFAAIIVYFWSGGNNPQGAPDSTGKDAELKEKIGQMIMMGFRGTEVLEGSDVYKMIKDVKVGGVVLFDYDVPSNSYPRNIVSPEHMNLAPVVDLNLNPKNPIIGVLGRSFSSNPEEVFDKSKVFIRNHLVNNIITVEKHFPG